MKNLLLVLMLAAAALPAAAQERTLVSGQVEHGGFGAPVVRFTQIHDQFGVLVGGRGGWIINHTFSIGGGGYGLANKVEAEEADSVVTFGYGGGELEWIINSDDLLHFTVYALIGAGGISIREDFWENHGDGDGNGRTDGLFVGDLTGNLELNIASWFRVNFGAGYRLVSGVEIPGYSNSDFGGPSGHITLKFGKF
ncbi:MAG: hypothetical protein C4524_08570 [Candidatus Zixiibacteriota bacterium]|nr:MAG: hypothetical protein C4524_08570 [candidate division Zixibacteria bacterium]